MINLSSFIEANARKFPNRCALKFEGREISYAEFFDHIARLGSKLQALGVGEGDVVALLMKNSAAYLQLAFAVSHIGAVFLPINFRLSKDEVDYVCRDANARLIFVDQEFEANSPSALQTIILARAEQADAALLAADCARAPMSVRKTGDIMRLMYTSGTTSRPKGVVHSYENFYWKSIDHVLALNLNSDTRLLVCGPLYHVGAFDLPGVAVLWAGGMLSILRDFDPARVLEAIERDRITGAWFAPVMTSSLLSYRSETSYRTDSLKWVIAGGERTPEGRIHDFGQLFPAARYVDAYGLTESCSGDTMMEEGYELSKIGSVGRPLMHVEVSIRNDAGHEVASGQAGEICLRGPKITKGYWNAPDKTLESFSGEWFRTGDVGYVDDDGFLFVTDRLKDMIISGGENIASLEVERVIGMMPQVAEVAVIGLPDERWGEKPAAVIVPRQGETLTLDDVAAYCRQHLAPYKVPRAVFIYDALPRNPSGKVLKNALRGELEQ